MPFWWLVQLVVAVAFAVIAYSLAPKPKKQKPQAVQDAEEPKAEAGIPIPVVWGTANIKSPNVLRVTNKGKRSYKVSI